jgi:hypothetical protein
MRRITLLLMLMAIALLAVSGAAWAETKTCPPVPTVCTGTSGADVLESSSQDNNMQAKAGDDTYTNFVRGDSGRDSILDDAGVDTLKLTDYSKDEPKLSNLDRNHNGNADSLFIDLPQGNQPKNSVTIVDYYDDTASDPPKSGPGYIETIEWRVTAAPPTSPTASATASAATTTRPLRSAGFLPAGTAALALLATSGVITVLVLRRHAAS